MLVSDLKTGLKKYGFRESDPLLLWLNESYHTMEIEIPDWSYLETTLIKELKVSEEGIFTLAANVKRPVKVRDITEEINTQGEGFDLEYITLARFERDFSNQKAQGQPEFYALRGNGEMLVYPLPTETRKLRITIIKELADLVADAEEPASPQSHHYCIVLGAAYIGLMAENEEERATTAQNQFESKLSKLVDDDREKQVGEPEYVEEY